MRSITACILAALILSYSCFLQHSPAAPAEQVQTAIEKSTKYIYSQMKGDNWEVVPQRDPRAKPNDVRGAQWGSLTALSIYSLLSAGESPQEPRLAKAIEFLRSADLTGTYAVALRAQALLTIPKNDSMRTTISTDAKLLVHSYRTVGTNRGLFHFTNEGTSGPTDLSNSQFGVLGLRACWETDPEAIPDSFWIAADASWRKLQGDDGSWAYDARPGTTDAAGNPVQGNVAMTAAGITTLFITQDVLKSDHGLACSGNIVDPNIDLGLKWMAEHFADATKDNWPFYDLYGIEMMGAASGYKYLGDNDWYKHGTDYILHAQKASDGSLPAIKGSNYATSGSLINTCAALLFLSRGRAPVMMNKLQYSIDGQEANWNERPRDAANIARWVGKQTENTLNWQISTIKAPVDDWHDAPILYIAGNQALSFAPDEQDKLRTFVEQGGLILGIADCGKTDFSDSFRKLGTSLFKNYEFAPVGDADPIMHAEQFDASKWKQKPTLLSLSNGARALMLLIPQADPGKAWQMQETGGKEQLFELAANIFLYAVDKENLFVKGDSYVMEPVPAVKALHTIEVARIQYDGNWDPEPGGWRRMNAVMHNGDSLDVKATPVDPTGGLLAGMKTAHLTGTNRFTLSDAAISAIQQFIRGGGTLIVDAAGGKPEFAESAEKALHLIFPDDADQLHQPLAIDSTIYTSAGKLDEITYRSFSRGTLGEVKGPRLRGIVKDGRLVCIYSPEDLSVGLVGEPVDGIIGYSPATATALMRRALLLSSGEKPVTPPGAVKPKKASTPRRSKSKKSPTTKKATTAPAGS